METKRHTEDELKKRILLLVDDYYKLMRRRNTRPMQRRKDGMTHEVSEVQIVPIKPSNGLVGFASFVFDGCMYCGSIGIYTRPAGGYRLTYPTRKGANGDFNIFHPISREVAEEIEQAVTERFENVTKSYDRHNSINTD